MILSEELHKLTFYHYQRCQPYRNIIDNLYPQWDRSFSSCSIENVPYLPVSLFKRHDLMSVDPSQVVRVLTSSGTTGQQVSRIFLDDETAKLQSQALISIMTEVLGPKRMPMIVLDTKDVLKNKNMTARGAGIVGMMNFGSRPFFALNEDMSLDIVGLKDFLQKNGSAKFFMFGFTFMVWCYFFEQIQDLGLDLPNGILIHSGGWKKMLQNKVDNSAFKMAFKEKTGLSKIHNFYGMVEQVGSVYVEGEDGLLKTPSFSDVIVRDPITMQPSSIGEIGIIQVLSSLPKSYPGHSILTEDLGIIHRVNEDGTKAFSVFGRVPKAEVRGCSDTHEGK